jgi:hypothetical protein
MKIGSITNNSVMLALWAMAASSCQATSSTGTTRIAGYQTKSRVTGVSEQTGASFFFREPRVRFQNAAHTFDFSYLL